MRKGDLNVGDMRKRMTALLVSAALGVTTLAGIVAAPAQAVSSCQRFRLVTESMDWLDAREAARQAGGRLATINSAREQRCVESVLNATCGMMILAREGNRPHGFPCYDGLWLGGSDRLVEGVWRWDAGRGPGIIFWKESTGRGTRFVRWNEGEPNDVGGEDCLEMTPIMLSPESRGIRPAQMAPGIEMWRWNDGECNDEQWFVIEF